jgi:hypothetical protein
MTVAIVVMLMTERGKERERDVRRGEGNWTQGFKTFKY